MVTTSDLAIDLTEVIAIYMRAKFLQKLHGNGHNVSFPADLDFGLLQECDQAVSIILEAYQNARMNQSRVILRSTTHIYSVDQTTWKADDYVVDLTARATGQNLKVEGKLLKKYPPIFSPPIYEMKPCTVQDEDENVMLWYIPGALSKKCTVSIHAFFTCRSPTADRGYPQRTKFGRIWNISRAH